jgi:hypothetical protein
MPTFYVYSHEPMPRTDLFEKRDYNPANDYIAFNGVWLNPVPAKTWTAIPDRIRSVRHRDRSDKAGTPYHVFADELVSANRERLGPRGVIFTDHLPDGAEKAELEATAEARNLQFRLDLIQQYEEALKEAEANGRTVKANTYLTECYNIAGMERPGSVEALRAQRQPGEAVANRLVEALEQLVNKMSAARSEKQPRVI